MPSFHSHVVGTYYFDCSFTLGQFTNPFDAGFYQSRLTHGKLTGYAAFGDFNWEFLPRVRPGVATAFTVAGLWSFATAREARAYGVQVGYKFCTLRSSQLRSIADLSSNCSFSRQHHEI